MSSLKSIIAGILVTAVITSFGSFAEASMSAEMPEEKKAIDLMDVELQTGSRSVPVRSFDARVKELGTLRWEVQQSSMGYLLFAAHVDIRWEDGARDNLELVFGPIESGTVKLYGGFIDRRPLPAEEAQAILARILDQPSD